MNFLTQVLHLVGSGAVAYISARNLRDLQTRPNTLAALQWAESNSVPYLEALRDRATAEGNPWLAERLDLHASDEHRHAQIFAHGLKALNQQAIDLSTLPRTKADGTPDERRRSPFFAVYFEGYSQEALGAANVDWIVFLASTYILELDASKDFVRMANVLPDQDLQSRNLKLGILSVAQDETRHAAYLREALERRLSAWEVEGAIAYWRTRKVNAMLAMVGGFLQRGGKFPTFVREGAPVDLPVAEAVSN